MSVAITVVIGMCLAGLIAFGALRRNGSTHARAAYVEAIKSETASLASLRDEVADLRRQLTASQTKRPVTLVVNGSQWHNASHTAKEVSRRQAMR